MDVPARLNWRKEKDRFAAYPLGPILPDRLAWIAPFGPVHRSWKWVVSWEGWFSEHGIAPGKQEAADEATRAWWRLVQTEVPRDVDFDATRIVAQALVKPVPNSLYHEDGPFLQKVLWHLMNVHGQEVATGDAPARIVDLIAQLEAEIERRFQSGELRRPIAFTPQKMRRHRR